MTNNTKKNFIWNLIGLSAYSLVSFLLLIIVKRANGVDEAGIFTYAFSLSTLFFYLSLYYNRTFQIANYDKENTFNHYLSTRLVTSLISIVLIILFSIISGFNGYKILIIVLLFLFRIVDAISDCFYGYIQSKDKLYQVGISYSLKSIFGILMFILIDILTNSVCYALTSLIVINIIFFLLYDLSCFKKLNNKKISFDFSRTKPILKQSFSIFLFSFLAIYLANAQKYVITYFSSDELQTIFGILIMPATILSLIGNYLIHPFLNTLNNYRVKNEYKNFNKLIIKILLALLILGIMVLGFIYFFGIWILNIIYAMVLDKYLLYLMLIIIAALLNAMGMIISSALTLLNKNNLQAGIYFISSLVATISCYLLIKKGIIFGAAISYLISSVTLVILFIAFYTYVIRLRIKGDKNE